MDSPSSLRRQREKALLKQQILDAARTLLQEGDYHSLSLRRIADRIQYSPTTIYLYFKDKGDLVLALIEEGFQELSQRMREIQEDDPVRTLERRAQAYLRFGLEQPQYYRLMFQLQDPQLHQLCRRQPQRVSQECFDILLETVGQLRQSQRLRMDRGDLLTAHILWASLHGAVELFLADLLDYLSPAQQEEYQEATVAALLHMVTGF